MTRTAGISGHTALAALCLGLLAGCSTQEVNANFTGVYLTVTYPSALALQRIELSGSVRGRQVIADPDVPTGAASNLGSDRKRLELSVMLDGALAGERILLEASGFEAGDELAARGVLEVGLRLGQVSSATLAMARVGACGDGKLDFEETCDDGGNESGDGCNPTCEVEAGFACYREPSRCVLGGQAAFVDSSAQCPGMGTESAPYCSLEAALRGSGELILVLRPGRFLGPIDLGAGTVTIVAETGAILESAQAPALRISSGAELQIFGLAVQGDRGVGGGIVVEGPGSRLDLANTTVGPGSAIGLELRDGATLSADGITIRGHAGGGLRLDTTEEFRVVNSIIAGNGTNASSFGGVLVSTSSAQGRFIHDTVVSNRAAPSAGAPSARCEAPARFVNGIFWSPGDLSEAADFGACEFLSSDVGPLAPGATVGTSTSANLSADPRLGPDFHLLPESPCIDAAEAGVDPKDEVPLDLDGDTRPFGSRPDVGADELVPADT